MINLKQVLLILLLAFLYGCGGSNNEGPDYTTFTDSDMMALADQLKDKGDYQNSINHYKRLLLEFPTSNLHIQAQLQIAECYAGMDKWEEQFNTLERLVTENIIPEEVPQLYIQIGRFYERAAQFNPGVITTDSIDYKLAMDYYDKALNYPDSDDNIAKSESVYRRALVEAKIGKIDAAVARYKLVSTLFPTSEFSILSQMKLRDPQNTSELVTTDSAVTRYKQVLGLIETDEEFEEEVIEQKTDRELESTIDALDMESQEYQEEPADEAEEENYYEENPENPVDQNMDNETANEEYQEELDPGTDDEGTMDESEVNNEETIEE